jgi:hypothetical protein
MGSQPPPRRCPSEAATRAMTAVDGSELDSPDERAVPLLLAIGRLVLGAAALENVLLVDIVMREFHREGQWRDELVQELSELEGRPAGKLLERLRGLGISGELADRIFDVISRRNRVIHHLMKDPEVSVALETGEGMEKVVADIDRIATDCQQSVNELIVVAFPSLEAAFGMTLAELANALGSIDLDTIEDPNLRQQLHAARVMREALNWEPKHDSEKRR